MPVDATRYPALAASNKRRAAKGADAIRSGGYDAGTDHTADDTPLTDLLADLMHYADHAGHDIDEAYRRARGHFEAEAVEPDDLAQDYAASDDEEPEVDPSCVFCSGSGLVSCPSCYGDAGSGPTTARLEETGV